MRTELSDLGWWAMGLGVSALDTLKRSTGSNRLVDCAFIKQTIFVEASVGYLQ